VDLLPRRRNSCETWYLRDVMNASKIPAGGDWTGSTWDGPPQSPSQKEFEGEVTGDFVRAGESKTNVPRL